jgi:hypothetical protein
MTKQVATVPVTVQRIMKARSFERGFKDVRAGIPFDWRIGGDDTNDAWSYERGRHFAFIAPISMPLHIDSKLNPKAVALCQAAFNRDLIL